MKTLAALLTTLCFGLSQNALAQQPAAPLRPDHETLCQIYDSAIGRLHTVRPPDSNAPNPFLKQEEDTRYSHDIVELQKSAQAQLDHFFNGRAVPRTQGNPFGWRETVFDHYLGKITQLTEDVFKHPEIDITLRCPKSTNAVVLVATFADKDDPRYSKTADLRSALVSLQWGDQVSLSGFFITRTDICDPCASTFIQPPKIGRGMLGEPSGPLWHLPPSLGIRLTSILKIP
jgi:hypothetical protein